MADDHLKISCTPAFSLFNVITVKMVSNRLSKVHKQITKKKGKTPNLHENSRDTQRLQRAAGRDDKLNRLVKLREKQNRTYCMSIRGFSIIWLPLIVNSIKNQVFSVIHH